MNFKNFINFKNSSSFTLMELTIVIALIALIGTAILVLLNPKKQLEKSWDARRKAELATLQKTFEDFYNDNNSYPDVNNVCFPASYQLEENVCSCYICGREVTSPDFSPYLSSLPCDPQYPQKTYYYQYDCANYKPNWFKICALLSELPSNGNYNYGVSSQNVNPDDCQTVTLPGIVPGELISPTPTTIVTQPTNTPGAGPTATPTIIQAPTPTLTVTPGPSPTPGSCPADPTSKYCRKAGICNVCGTFSQCNLPGACTQPIRLFSDYSCYYQCE